MEPEVMTTELAVTADLTDDYFALADRVLESVREFRDLSIGRRYVGPVASYETPSHYVKEQILLLKVLDAVDKFLISEAKGR